MARIRTIKPEFWTSPQIVDCSIPARLLFVGLLNFCDDNGIHPASVSRLRMQVFPEDGIADTEIRAMVHELIGAGLVAPYRVDEEPFWVVTGWSRHQKIDRPTYRHPLPDGRFDVRFTDEDRRTFVESIRRENSSNQLVESARRINSGTEWNGMESKGETPPSQDGEITSTTEKGKNAPSEKIGAPAEIQDLGKGGF